MEGVQKLSKQNHTGNHRACHCLCLTSKFIINIICYSKDLPSHFHQLHDIGGGESTLIFQDIKQMAHVLWMEKTPHVPLQIQTHKHVVMCPRLSIACLSLKYYCILCFLVRNLLLVCFGTQSLASWFFHLFSLGIVAVAISYYLPRSLPSEIYLFILCLNCPPSYFMCLWDLISVFKSGGEIITCDLIRRLCSNTDFWYK